jgi:hypothetical protein
MRKRAAARVIVTFFMLQSYEKKAQLPERFHDNHTISSEAGGVRCHKKALPLQL